MRDPSLRGAGPKFDTGKLRYSLIPLKPPSGLTLKRLGLRPLPHLNQLNKDPLCRNY